MEEEADHPLYTLSLYGLILLFNIIVATIAWYCFNLIGHISFTDAFIFVFIFRVIEWAKQTILEMSFG